MPSSAGNRTMASNGTTSRPASRPRTASSSRSTAGCATNASTSTCSPISPRLAGSSKPGALTTTPHGHTPALAGSHQRSLQHAPTRGITRTDSPSERGHSGEHVSVHAVGTFRIQDEADESKQPMFNLSHVNCQKKADYAGKETLECTVSQ